MDAAIAGADVATLDRWFTHALTASTIEETGILTTPAR
jgi:hypothetical protein